MTDQRLCELLQERVADMTTTDLASGAWEDAGRMRRRRTVGVIAGAVAALAVAGGVTTNSGGDRDTGPAPPATSPSVNRSADAEYRGVPVWWGPDVEAEADLPLLADSPLPATIDLASATTPVPRGVRAVALIQAGSRVVVQAVDDDLYTLDVSRLDWMTDAGGDVHAPFSDESLAPDGRHAFFVQTSSLEVYDFADGTWSTIHTPRSHARSARWVSDTEIYVSAPGREPDEEGTTYDLEGNASPTKIDWVPVWDVPTDQPWGPQRGAARSYVINLSASSMAVIVTDGGESKILAMPEEWDASVGPGRMKVCCQVVGWLDPDVVLFESRSTEGNRILAWRAGTREVSMVTDVRGLYVGASIADLSRD